MLITLCASLVCLYSAYCALLLAGAVAVLWMAHFAVVILWHVDMPEPLRVGICMAIWAFLAVATWAFLAVPPPTHHCDDDEEDGV